MLLALAATVLAILAGLAGWYADQVLLRCRLSFRPILAVLTLSMGIWLLLVILGSHWLRVPGAYGPIQYWIGAEGSGLDFFAVRALAMFIVCGAVLVVPLTAMLTVVEVASHPPQPGWTTVIIPLLGIGVFILACWVFFAYEFFPSA